MSNSFSQLPDVTAAPEVAQVAPVEPKAEEASVESGKLVRAVCRVFGGRTIPVAVDLEGRVAYPVREEV